MNLLGELYADAVVSRCERYRYRLRRAVGGVVLDAPGSSTLAWIMLNPSTADATADDATIRKVVGFTRRASATQLEVVNLFAFRATEPDDLWRAAGEGRDVVGPENDEHLVRAVRGATGVVVAWGACPSSSLRRARFRRRVQAVYDLLQRDAPATPWLCLGRTEGAIPEPRHPLFVRSAQLLERWYGL